METRSLKTYAKHMAKLSIPVMIESVLGTTATMVDTAMLGSLGERTVAAVGICSQYSSLMFSGIFGFFAGATIFFTQYFGEKNEKGMAHTHGIALSIILAITLAFGLVGFFAPEFVMRVYTDKTMIQTTGLPYLRIVAFSYPLIGIAMITGNLLRTKEQVRIPMIASICGLVTNIVLNYVLIFGKFGFPQMGVAGAATATVAAELVNILMLYVLAAFKREWLIYKFKEFFHPDFQLFKAYVRKSIPLLCNELFIGIGNALLNIIIGRQSESALAAMAVFRVLEGFIFAAFRGISSSGGIIVGQLIGSGRHEAALKDAKRSTLVAPCFALTIILAIIALHRPLFSLMGLTGESMTLCLYMFFVYAVAGSLRSCNWLHNDLFRAGGDPIFGTVLEIICMFLIVVPSAYLAGMVWHLAFPFVFMCVYIDEPLRIFFLRYHMCTGKWIKPVTEMGKATIQEFRVRHHIA